LNGGARTGNATFTARAEGHGEPGNHPPPYGSGGTPDYYTVPANEETANQDVFTGGEFPGGGHGPIHDCKHASKTSAPARRGGPGTLSTSSTGEGTTDLSAEGSSVSVLELYRPTPNPFSNTTSFAYQVSGSASQRVQIGIYNVTGR